MIALLLAAAVLATPAPSATGTELLVVPLPREVTLSGGTFPLRGELRIAVGAAEDRFAAELLAEEIASATSAKARVVEGNDGDIVLARDGSLANAGEEGYRIEARTDRIRATARTGAGVFYAVQTLRQMVSEDGIALGVIADRPALRWRGLQDDIARGPMPTVAALERRIRTAAEYKINLYALYMETSFDYQSQPLLAHPGGALTAAELKHLDEYAARHHVTLMVQQQSFGHLGGLLGWETLRNLAEVDGSSTITPADESTYNLLGGLYREIAPLTRSPFFHIGGDEPADLGLGRSRALVEAHGLAEVYARHVKRLRELLAPMNKRPIVWGDMMVKFPEILPKLGRDFIVASWEYVGHDTYAPWIEPLRKAKVEFLVCPGATNWNRVFPNLDHAIPNIRIFTREGQQAGALGQLNSTWADNGDALFALVWYPVLYAAAAAWQPGDCEPERFARAFDWAFFRNRGGQMAKVIRRLNTAHGLVSKARPTDVTLEVFWLNPARNALERQLCGMIEPVGVQLRTAAEESIDEIGRCRPQVRRNADLLDAYAFAARRIHSIGTRALFAKRMRDAYQQALLAQEDKARANQAMSHMTGILELLAQGRQSAALLKTEHERLWLAENRPYWLSNIQAQYDQDMRAWMTRGDELRMHTVNFRNGRRLPAADQVGIGP